MASAATVIITAVSNICLPFGNDMARFIGQSGFVLLQIALVVKYAAALVLVLPHRPKLKQVICGFLLGDVIAVAATALMRNPASLFICIIIGQIIFMCFYRFFERKRSSIPDEAHLSFNLMTQKAA